MKPCVAVLGLGSMGQRYVRRFRNRAKTYGCDIRPETFPADLVCFETVDQLLAQIAPTVAFIALPADQHLPALYAVREACPGCSILLEKPVSDHALDSSDLERCHALGGIIAVGYCWRFHPEVRQLLAFRHAIRDITLHVASDMRTWPGQRYADPLREFSHELDLVTYLTVKPRLTTVDQIQGRYIIGGEHRLGRWCVHIAPFHQPARWVRLRMAGDSIITNRWEQSTECIESMYSVMSNELWEANDEGGLTCPLRDALKTTVLIDEIEQRLYAQDTEVVM
jgi:predicted dehydrogenase